MGEAVIASIGGIDLEYSGERFGRDGYHFRAMSLRTNSEQEIKPAHHGDAARRHR